MMKNRILNFENPDFVFFKFLELHEESWLIWFWFPLFTVDWGVFRGFLR